MAPRTLFGKKVRRLRRAGVIPANIMQANQPSTAVEVSELELAAVVRQGSSGHLVDLVSNGESEPVLVDHVEIDPLTNRLVHASFRRVDLDKPVTTAVPVRLEGRAPASDSPDLLVLQLLDEIVISALPTQIPAHLIGDAAVLADLNDHITVAQLRAADGSYEPVIDPAETVAVVNLVRRVTEVTEEEAAAAELEELALAEGEPGAPEAADGPAEERPEA